MADEGNGKDGEGKGKNELDVLSWVGDNAKKIRTERAEREAKGYGAVIPIENGQKLKVKKTRAERDEERKQKEAKALVRKWFEEGKIGEPFKEEIPDLMREARAALEMERGSKRGAMGSKPVKIFAAVASLIALVSSIGIVKYLVSNTQSARRAEFRDEIAASEISGETPKAKFENSVIELRAYESGITVWSNENREGRVLEYSQIQSVSRTREEDSERNNRACLVIITVKGEEITLPVTEWISGEWRSDVQQKFDDVLQVINSKMKKVEVERTIGEFKVAFEEYKNERAAVKELREMPRLPNGATPEQIKLYMVELENLQGRMNQGAGKPSQKEGRQAQSGKLPLLV